MTCLWNSSLFSIWTEMSLFNIIRTWKVCLDWCSFHQKDSLMKVSIRVLERCQKSSSLEYYWFLRQVPPPTPKKKTTPGNAVEMDHWSVFQFGDTSCSTNVPGFTFAPFILLAGFFDLKFCRIVLVRTGTDLSTCVSSVRKSKCSSLAINNEADGVCDRVNHGTCIPLWAYRW